MYFKSNARVDKVKIENLTTEVESLKLKSQLTESLQSELQIAQLKIEELEKENKSLLSKLEEALSSKEPLVSETQEESQVKVTKPGRKKKGDTEDVM